MQTNEMQDTQNEAREKQLDYRFARSPPSLPPSQDQATVTPARNKRGFGNKVSASASLSGAGRHATQQAARERPAGALVPPPPSFSPTRLRLEHVRQEDTKKSPKESQTSLLPLCWVCQMDGPNGSYAPVCLS